MATMTKHKERSRKSIKTTEGNKRYFFSKCMAFTYANAKRKEALK